MIDHDPAIAHEEGVWYLDCARCRAGYDVHVATDPLRAPGTDDDPRLFIGGLWLGFTVAMGVFIALFAVTRMVR